jgi:hypothetical protein
MKKKHLKIAVLGITSYLVISVLITLWIWFVFWPPVIVDDTPYEPLYEPSGKNFQAL